MRLDATVWNGTAWSNGFPSSGKQIQFKEDYPALESTTANVCIVRLIMKTVTLLTGNSLELNLIICL